MFTAPQLEGVLAGLGRAVPPLSHQHETEVLGVARTARGPSVQSDAAGMTGAGLLPGDALHHDWGAQLSEAAGTSAAGLPASTARLDHGLETQHQAAHVGATSSGAGAADSNCSGTHVSVRDTSDDVWPAELDATVPLRVSLTIGPA